ncbi:MAG: hypothetical protein ACOY82_06355 [Pseudomonadota bacterium]
MPDFAGIDLARRDRCPHPTCCNDASDPARVLQSETRRATDRRSVVFRQGKEALSKNPDQRSNGRFELDVSVFFGDFLFEKKVTRAPARKRFRAFAELRAILPLMIPGASRTADGTS